MDRRVLDRHTGGLGSSAPAAKGETPHAARGDSRWISAVRSLHTVIYFVMAGSTLTLIFVAITGRLLGALWIVGPLLTVEVLVFVTAGLKCPLTEVVDRLARTPGSVPDTYLPDWLTRQTLLIFGPVLPVALMLLVARATGIIGGAS